MTFDHAFSDNFRSLHTFIIVELLERFSLKRIVLFSKKSVFFPKHTPNIVTVSGYFFVIFPLLNFCVKTGKHGFYEIRKGGVIWHRIHRK